MEKKCLSEEQILSSQFKRVFSTDDGKEVLLHILNDLGYFATDPKYIIPENLAIANKIVLTIGATNVENIKDFANSIVNCASIKEDIYE